MAKFESSPEPGRLYIDNEITDMSLNTFFVQAVTDQRKNVLSFHLDFNGDFNWFLNMKAQMENKR